MRGGDGQAVGPCKLHDRLIVPGGRAKTRGEFLWCQVMLIIRAGRVIELRQEIIQAFLVAQWQTNSQTQLVCS